jgi:hypothetical protein
MRSTGSVSLFAILSVALHLAWVAWMPEGQAATRSDAHWVEVSFEAATEVATAPAEFASNAQPEAAVEEAPQPTAAVVVAPRVQRERPKPEREQPKAAQVELPSPTPAQPARVAEAAPQQPAPTEQPSQPAAAEPGAGAEQPSQLAAAEPALAPSPITKRPSLSPRAAALSLDSFQSAAAMRCADRAPTAGPSECATATADAGHAAQAALENDLNTVAHVVPHLRRRERPQLKRRSDGSYAHDGHVFSAVVHPDGQVEFTDKGSEAELHPSLVPVQVAFDVNDFVERAVSGRELYSAEKQWFLEQTRELREQLATDARRRELQESNRALERTLQNVLGDRALSRAQKHDAVFLLWQDCGEDGQAKATRKVVNSFVKRYMPKDSEEGFLADELEHFNATRKGLQKFEPYAGS